MGRVIDILEGGVFFPSCVFRWMHTYFPEGLGVGYELLV